LPPFPQREIETFVVLYQWKNGHARAGRIWQPSCMDGSTSNQNECVYFLLLQMLCVLQQRLRGSARSWHQKTESVSINQSISQSVSHICIA